MTDKPRAVNVSTSVVGHVHLKLELAVSELSFAMSDGAITADISLDPRDALTISEALFGEVMRLAQERAQRIVEMEGRTLQ